MKHIVTFFLWICVFLLLSLFAHQKITGRNLDGSETRKKIDRLILRLRGNIRSIQIHTGAVTTTPQQIQSTGHSKLPKIKDGIQRNQEFLSNLKMATLDFRQSIGKGEIYAERVSSSDNKHDAVSVSASGKKLRYPAKYNTDNIFALDNNFNDRVYTNSGIQLLYVNGLHSIYYKALLSTAGQRGIIQNVEQGTSIMMDGLTPLLYYKSKYLFTLQEFDTQKSLFVLNDRNDLETLGGWSIENLAIDGDIVAFQDTEQGLIYFLELNSLKIIKTIATSPGRTFQGFVIEGAYLRIKLLDNVEKKNVFQKRSRSA